ncbi:threonine/homoserine efflux transporter RhtA [Paraburkholderia sp. WC7.3g]
MQEPGIAVRSAICLTTVIDVSGEPAAVARLSRVSRALPVAQRYAAPSHAAVIFSMEGVFAAFAGWLVLGETLTARALFGCALMLSGLIVCQVLPGWKRARQRAPQAS